MNDRFIEEKRHGRWLAQGDPEAVWGWGTPAGAIRANRRAQWIIQAAGLQPGMDVLEIGCGTGLFSSKFAETGCRLTAIDISPELLSIAKEKYRDLSSVVFIESSLEAFDSDSRYDAVVGSSILHHLELEAALAQVQSLLRPGGRIAFAEPNKLNPQIFIQKRIDWIKEKVGDVPTESAFSRFEIQQMLRNLGYEDLRIVTRDWLHPATPQPLIPTVKRLELILEKMPLVREFAGSVYLSGSKAQND